MKYILAIGAVLLALGATIFTLSGRSGPTGEPVAATTSGTAPAVQSGEMLAVALPGLTGDAAIGQKVFGARCAACHGPSAGGIEGAGPPLIHPFYVPGHHSDAAFFMAAERGVKAHHWHFGDMPPVEGITRAEVAAAVAFVRAVQRENGIN